MNHYDTTYNNRSYADRNDTTNALVAFDWISDGWRDIMRTPLTSAVLGLVFTGLCAAAFAVSAATPLFSVSILAFLLIVSPFIAATGYFTARQIEETGSASLRASLGMLRDRAMSIGMFSILNALVVAAWVRASGIVFALYYGSLGSASAVMAKAWTTGEGLTSMLLFGGLSGLVLALVLFTIGAFALPMIADRNANVITAARFSLVTLRDNLAAVPVWMLLIVLSTSIAVLSGLFLMPVIFPLLAYATWHSYRYMRTDS